ncbi:hypothetical protein DM75_3317 [Burkholderia mallei]|nr:hypothetical protein DM75_3317 [Burkholderia mallei]KOT21685.1 hypothetical protein DM52_1764 [Burkholderia mallei]
MAVRLVLAIATDREIRRRRQRGEHIEHPARVAVLHLGAELARERLPIGIGLRRLRFGDEFGARRQRRQPDVVKVARRELVFRHAARRTAHGADPHALVVGTRRAEPDDADAHAGLPFRMTGAHRTPAHRRRRASEALRRDRNPRRDTRPRTGLPGEPPSPAMPRPVPGPSPTGDTTNRIAPPTAFDEAMPRRRAAARTIRRDPARACARRRAAPDAFGACACVRRRSRSPRRSHPRRSRRSPRSARRRTSGPSAGHRRRAARAGIRPAPRSAPCT